MSAAEEAARQMEAARQQAAQALAASQEAQRQLQETLARAGQQGGGQ